MSSLDIAKYCFIPDEKEVFVIAEITQRNDAKREATVAVVKTKKVATLKYDLLVPIGSMEELDIPPSDLIKLIYVNRPGILHTLRSRFMQDRIYTSIGPILVALNPFKWISGLYEEDVMSTYKSGEANLSDNPHVFAVSNDAFNDLQFGQNQSLIISGESGAGKTEATKQCLNYLAFLAGSANGIQSKILKASPILEAWGNAKTLRNNNSSRFGKFIEIWFDSSFTITGSSNTTYILEKSRVVFQEKDERNYHVFYQLLKGGSSELLAELELSDFAAHPENANCINQSGCIAIENVDDGADFREVNDAFTEIGFTAEEQKSLYTIIAGILHFGNISYEANPNNSDESVIPPDALQHLERGARRFGVDMEFVKKALLYKTIRSGNSRRTSVAFAPYKTDAAYENKNALVKEIYRRCFDFIVGKINALMENDKDQAVNMIGILDIFGFEIFQKNSFEQLCINLANEALQQHFNYNIFQAEMDVYVAEDVPLPPLEYKDNQDVLDLITKKPTGLIPMLDEEGLVPKGSWEGFLSKFSKQHAKHVRFKKAKLVSELSVVHYAGDVNYDVSLFLVKNKDTLSADLVEVFSTSSLPMLQKYFTEPEEKPAAADAGGSQKRSAAQSGAKMTVGKSFSLQLEKLIADLNATNPRYIRCIKPNQVKKPNIFVPDLTNEQLTYSGVFEAVIIMQNGYPFRLSHADFRKKYHMLVRDAKDHALLFDEEGFNQFADTSVYPAAVKRSPGEAPEKIARGFSRDQCIYMVHLIAKANPGRDIDRCFPGKTRVFYRAQQHNALVQLSSVITQAAALRIQTRARTYLAVTLTRAIRRAEGEWFASLSSRSPGTIVPAAKKVDALVARLNKVVRGLNFSIECAKIGNFYCKAFASEDQLLPAIKAVLGESTDMMDKYDRLEVMLKDLDTVNFTIKYRASTLSFKWENNKDLKDQAEKIAAMGVLVRVKRKFRSGISGKNEVALEEAMQELETLRSAGRVEAAFCEEECTRAHKIITEAEVLFGQLLTSVAAAVGSGKFATSHAPGSVELQISVDAGALNALISAHEREMRDKPADAVPPMRVRSLQLLCRQLRDLRTSARDKKWEATWGELTKFWNLPTSPTEEEISRSGLAMSEKFLPADLKRVILEEKKDISLATINFFVVPQVQAQIDSGGVPSAPTLGTSAVPLVDTAGLASQIASADAYAEFFDEDLQAYMALAREHLHCRTEVASGDWARITALNPRKSVVPATHPDRANIRNFVKMFDAVNSIKARVLQDKITGEPGSFDFTSIQVAELADACAAANALTVKGKAWVQLLETANTLRDTRQLLQKEKFTEAWTLMQGLATSPSWLEISTGVKDKTADVTVLSVLTSAVEELHSYESEILHARAMKDIAAALSIGGIGDDTTDFSAAGVSASAVQGELDSKSPQLIPTPAAKQLVEDCKVVIKLRTFAFTGQWGEVEKAILPLREKSDGFKACDVNCQTELHRYYNKVFDLKVRAQLQEGMASGRITMLADETRNRCDRDSIVTSQLEAAVKYAGQGFVLGSTTKDVFRVASGLYCLRSLVIQDSWEPSSRFFFGNTATADLAGQIATLDTNPALSKVRGSIGNTIASLGKLESEVQVDAVGRLVQSSSLSELSITEVLRYLTKTLPANDPALTEAGVVGTLYNERRCVLLLLLSASCGRIKGTLDDFDCSQVMTNHIESTLTFVDATVSALGPSPEVVNWAAAARYLLSVRQTILRATADAPDDEPNLSEVFSVQELQDILATITAGYPVQELKLVLNKLKDQTSFQELLQALNFGKPMFENGKIDIKRIQHAHLQERLESAKKNPVRSDRLDRLFFYVELTISMRTAIGLGQWELSEREKSNSEGASAMLTVKRCLREFEQARRFFSSHISGVPPQSVVDEFRLIGREWERRLVKQRFSTAFKSGAVTGHPLALSLTGLRTDLLETEIARMKEVQNAAVEKDADFEHYMQAGAEVISIRREASKILASYKHPMKFAFASDSLHTILDAHEFIPDAIAKALDAVNHTAVAPHRFVEEWKPVDALVQSIQGCPNVPAAMPEIELVTGESLDRAYLAEVLGAINAAQNLPKSPRAQNEIINRLVAAQEGYNQRQAQRLAESNALGWRKARAVRQNRVLETMQTSAVVLLHYLRALSNNTFDPYSRDWKEDKNFSKTPRLYTMTQNLTASYTMQQVLRSSFKVVLQSKVQNLISAAVMRLEDAISQQEMLLAFTEQKYVFVGAVGGITSNALAVPYMQNVLERVERVGVHDAAVKKQNAFFVMHMNLRQAIQRADHAAAFAVLDDFLGNGKRSLVFVLEVLTNKNYQVVPEAAQEFLLLTHETCDRTWQTLAEQSVVQDRIRGKRGALHASEVRWQKIDAAAHILESLPAASARSHRLNRVCGLVKELRFRLLGNGAFVVDPDDHTGESGIGFQKLQFVHKRSEFGAVAGKILNKFTDHVIATACSRVDALTSVNLTWDHLDDLSTFVQYVQPIVNALNERVDGDFAVTAGIKDELLQECELVTKHCEALQTGMALESAIETELKFAYSRDGLSIQHDTGGRLLRTLAGANAQRWQLLGHPHEYWWACLTALAKSFLGLMDQAGVGSQDVLVLRPGTELFKTVLPTMYALIAQVNNIGLQLKSSGYRKRASLPTSILDACTWMRTAIVEHNTLTRLERIVSADGIVSHVTEDTNVLRVEVVLLRPLLQIDKDEDLPYKSTFEQYANDIKNMIVSAKVETTLGKLLVEMLLELVDLRTAVATKNWFAAKQKCATFHWIPEFATCPDVDVCQRFLRYKEYHRAIENAIVCCSLPTTVGWSLHAASRDIATTVNDATLAALIQTGQAKYGNLAVQYLSLSQLLTVGEKMLMLVDLVRRGLWVGSAKYSDEVSGGNPGEGSRYISAECRAFPEMLRILVDASHTLEPHMKQFLLQTAANLDTELAVVQLEHLAQKTLRAARLLGKPGELLIPEDVIGALKALCTQIAGANSLVKRCHSLRAAEHCAKLFIKVVEAHVNGDLGIISKFFDLLFYLNGIDCRPGVVTAADFPTIAAITDDELLKLEDSAFSQQIFVKATPVALSSEGRGALHEVDGVSAKDPLIQYWDEAHLTDKADLQKAFVLATGSAFTDAIALRTEVQEMLPLLHQHIVVEYMATEFVQVVKVTDPQKEPGDLDLSLIRTEELAAYVDKYSPYYAVPQKAGPNFGNLMLDMTRALLAVRRGQLEKDVELTASGLEQAGAACVKENEYQLLPGMTPFGGKVKACFEHILEEVEFADQDLRQRRLVVQLRSALGTTGLPTTHYPFNISGIFVATLEKVYEFCNELPPACVEARNLHQAASILLVLRKYALRRAWSDMIEFYNNLEVDDLRHAFEKDLGLVEFSAAKEIMMVSQAIEIAIESYQTGYLGGCVGAIAPCGDLFFNAKEPKSALNIFETLAEDWMSPGVLLHFHTCQTLFAIRSNASMRKWDAVLAAAEGALSGLRSGTRFLVALCIPEVTLARDHAAYVISLQQARLALSAGSLRGSVGDVHTWQVEIDTLMQCYATITSINCPREDIQRFKTTLEFLFRLRRAILLDQWISPDITHDYLTLLGSNFQLQEERVQQKNLYAQLTDRSVVAIPDLAVLAEASQEGEVGEGAPPVTMFAENRSPTPEEKSPEGPSGADATALPDSAEVAVPIPPVETVESILAQWAVFRESGALAPEGIPEVDLMHLEMRHRTMVSLLLKNIHTPGIQGLPGLVDTSQAVTRLLEKAIVIVTENSDVSMRGDCKGLLRDAKLLLMARRYRINEQWVELHHMLEEIELTLSNEAAAEEAAAAVDDTSSTLEDAVQKEYVRSIVKPVWQELQLLKFDTLFQLYLTNFKHEMGRPAPPPPPDGTPPINSVVVSQQRIDIVRTILECTEAAAQEYPSPDFARLVEAEAAALELRKFCQQFPNKSPQEIIHLVAQTKKRDEDAEQTSYMALLIHEISQMSNVLDFPVNLKTIRREIVKGNKYFSCPIGQLDLHQIDMEIITVAYNAAIPSLELFGTENDHEFMKLAVVVIKLRGALVRNGLDAAMHVLDNNEEVLQDSLVREEVERLRIEKENFEAGRLMEIGLRTGRYIDVLAIARMVHNYEARIAARAAAAAPVETNPLLNFGPEAKRASRRSAKRVSKEVSEPSAQDAEDHHHSSHAERRSRVTLGSPVVGGKRRSVQVEEGTASEEFVEGVFRSINALNRAIAIANQVRVRSANTEFYLNAVQVILRLREYTVADSWDEVKKYINTEETWQNLPTTALEEIQACKEGLLYQQHISRISHGFYTGAIYGLPHEIDYDLISYDELVAGLQTCEAVQFSDPSAVLLMEFAERLISVRHLLLSDQWMDGAADGAEVADFSEEAPSKLRKSIYSHPVPVKHETRRETVDTAVQEFLEFQSTAIPKLQAMLRVASQIDGEDRIDVAAFVQEARLVLNHRGDAHDTPLPGPDGWVTQIWHSVMHVVLEINLAQQVIQYRTVLLHLMDAADGTPDLVKAYVLDRHQVHANLHPLLRTSHDHEDITLYGARGAASFGSYAAGGSMTFDVAVLAGALQRAKDYLAFVGFETSEDMLKMQETCKLLIEFRRALNEQQSHDHMLQLLIRTKTQAAKGFLSGENGIFELNAYIASTAESVRIQNGLRAAIQSQYVHGPLNALHTKDVRTAELQVWIDDAIKFLNRGGAALSIGVPVLLLQARVIHKLRSALLDNEWSALEYTLRSYDAQAGSWEVAALEFQHIKNAFAFRCIMNQIRTFVGEFTSDADLGHSLMCLDVDLRALNKIFGELNELLQYSSPLLRTASVHHFDNPEESVEVPEEVVTAEFFAHAGVASCIALWRIYKAMHRNAWFVKQAVHDCEGQRIAEHVDPFLFAVFSVADSNYVSNVCRGVRAEDILLEFSAVPNQRQDTVFSTLVSTSWAGFPYTVRVFFSRVRNRLIDRFIRADLKYYCKKGAVTMDASGNLVLSSMNMEFLKITLNEAQRATTLARSMCVPFEWSKETQKWLDSAKTALKYRQTMFAPGTAEKVVQMLKGDGMMRGHTQFEPRLFSIHGELEVLEKYAQAHVAEKVALEALQFVVSQAQNSSEKFGDVALENDAVLHLFEVATAPIPVAEPSAYLLDMLQIVSLTRDAIFAAMLGGKARFLPIAESLRDAVGRLQNSALQSVDINKAITVLTAACKKAYHAELLDLKVAEKTAPKRNLHSPAPHHHGRQTAQYVRPAVPAAAEASPAKRVMHDVVTELSGVARLEAFTQKIVTALCELLYFQQGEAHYSIGGTEELIEKLRRKVPTSPRSQAPFHCYLTLQSLARDMDELYVVYNPRWATALRIVLYYLEKEMKGTASEAQNVAQMVDLSQDLVGFCKDIQLDRSVLSAHLLEKAQHPHSRLVTADQDTSPTVLVLVKHLTAIRLKGATTAGAGMTGLKQGLQGAVQSAEEAATHASALSLDRSVVGQIAEDRAAVLRALPLGSVSRAVAHTKLFVKALL